MITLNAFRRPAAAGVPWADAVGVAVAGGPAVAGEPVAVAHVVVPAVVVSAAPRFQLDLPGGLQRHYDLKLKL
jgi:hypothetical protein